jgi:hypothetical protein
VHIGDLDKAGINGGERRGINDSGRIIGYGVEERNRLTDDLILILRVESRYDLSASPGTPIPSFDGWSNRIAELDSGACLC